MSHPHDTVRVLPVQVGIDGTVAVFDRRYWSPESVAFASRMVEIRIAPAPHLKGFLVSGSKRLCEVALVEDSGFANVDAAREAAGRLHEKRSSVVDRKIEALTQIIDHRIEMDRCAKATIFDHAFMLGLRLIDRAKRMFGFGGGNVAEQQVLDRVDAVLDLGQIIFGVGHGDLPSGMGEAIEAEQRTPRLSRGVKQTSGRRSAAA